MDPPWMLPQAGYSNDPPQGMYTANGFIPDEPGHGTDRSSILDQTSVAGYPGIEVARGYGHAFDISSTVDQAPLLMGNGVEYQHGHRGQNIVPQQDTGFGQTGSPSMGTSAQDPMTSLDDKTSQLQRLAKHALELSKELFDFSRSMTRMPNGTPNVHARATRQRQEAIGGHLETLANLNCRLYNMLKQDCLKQYSMRSSEQARFLPSPNIASSSTGRSAVDAQPLGSMQYMPAAHALNSNTEVPVHPHDNNALGQSLAAANQSTSKGKEGKSKSKKGNKKSGDDDGDGAVSWHVPGKPARGTTDWRFLRDLAKNNPEKFIADYPNDLHDDMLWLIAEQHNYNRLKKFVDKVRSHHPGFEEFAAPPKPPQNASKKEKKAWVDKFKNRFCKALSRSGEKFGLTGKYKWDVFEPKAGWLDVHRWRENDCPKIIPYTKEEKKAMREAKKVKDARDAILNAVAAGNTTETGTSSHGEASDEGEGNLAFSESEVLASVNHGPFQEEVEQVQPMPQYYDHYRDQAQQQPSGYPDLTAMPTFTSGHIIPEEEYLGESEHDEPPPTRTTTAEAIRPFPRDSNRSYKRKRAEDESHQEEYQAHPSKYQKGPNSKISAPQSVSPASLPIDPSLDNFDDLFNGSHDFNIATDDFHVGRSRDVDAYGAAGMLFGQQDTDGPLTQYHRGDIGHGGWDKIFYS